MLLTKFSTPTNSHNENGISLCLHPLSTHSNVSPLYSTSIVISSPHTIQAQRRLLVQNMPSVQTHHAGDHKHQGNQRPHHSYYHSPPLLHDCMVEGYDTSVLISSNSFNTTQHDADINLSLPSNTVSIHPDYTSLASPVISHHS